jgi:superfamily II DNA/RNA helicase
VLVKRYLDNPTVHSVDPAVAEVTTMTHHVFAVSLSDKPTVVRELAAGRDRSLLFTRTKHGAKKLAKQLTMAGIPAVELHGNLSQAARERNLEAFSDGSSTVLVATDIAARGLHVDDIALVVHVDPPAEHKAFLHRSGRTARAGSDGVVVTLMLPEQVSDVKSLARAAKIEPIITRVAPGHSAISTLVGDPAPLRKAPAGMALPPTHAPRRSSGRGRPNSAAKPSGTGGGARSAQGSRNRNRGR